WGIPRWYFNPVPARGADLHPRLHDAGVLDLAHMERGSGAARRHTTTRFHRPPMKRMAKKIPRTQMSASIAIQAPKRPRPAPGSVPKRPKSRLVRVSR